jgi:hypothetical protein
LRAAFFLQAARMLSSPAIAAYPRPAKPSSIIAQVEAQERKGQKAAIVALPVLNAAVKKPDVNRVAFVSITN